MILQNTVLTAVNRNSQPSPTGNSILVTPKKLYQDDVEDDDEGYESADEEMEFDEDDDADYLDLALEFDEADLSELF